MKKTAVFVLGDLGYGDGGKGGIADCLVRHSKASAIVRYAGGPNAAHHVVADDETSHGFCHFGSTFVPTVASHLGREFIVKPQNLMREASILKILGMPDPCARLSIDPECQIVTPFHAMIGQMLEIARGENRHGSVGMGIGQAIFDRQSDSPSVIRIRDLFDAENLKRKLRLHLKEKTDQAEHLISRHSNPELRALADAFAREVSVDGLVANYRHFAERLSIRFVSDRQRIGELVGMGKPLVFEGAHGSLIDGRFGFKPHVTQKDTTNQVAETMLRPFQHRLDVTRIGIVRAYNYRHGAGPLVTEDRGLTKRLRETHNTDNRWQGKTRAGWFDMVGLRYAMKINRPVDYIALTMLDRIAEVGKFRVCVSYEHTGPETDLDECFETEDNGRLRIVGIKPCQSDRLTELLFDCRPFEYLEFDGNLADIRGAKRRSDLPAHVNAFVDLLESDRGAGVPAGIISVGPYWKQKIFSQNAEVK